MILKTLLTFATFSFISLLGVSKTAYATDTLHNDIQFVTQSAVSNILGAQVSKVYFGLYKQQKETTLDKYFLNPIEWRVLENNNNQLFLFADKCLDVKPYNETYRDITWEQSTIRSWLNGYDASKNKDGKGFLTDNFKDTAFTETEFGAIAVTLVHTEDNTGLPHTVRGGNDTNDKIFLLSVKEATNTNFGFNGYELATDSARVAKLTDYAISRGAYNYQGIGYWWLRDPGGYEYGYDEYGDPYDYSYEDFLAAFVLENGSISYNLDPSQYHTIDYIGEHVNAKDIIVRPAFKLNLNSVAFLSCANFCKGELRDLGELKQVGSNQGDYWKMTLLDDGSENAAGNKHKDFTINSVQEFVEGHDIATLVFNYAGALTGQTEYISAIIKDKDDNIKYYGRIKRLLSDEDNQGEFTVSVSNKLGESDKLYVFNEQYNGNYSTDYISKLIEYTRPNSYKITFKVINGAWNDGEKTEKHSLVLDKGEGTLKLKASDIPAVGNNPDSDFMAGSWDIVPSIDTEITQDSIFTYTYARKPTPTPTSTLTPNPTKVPIVPSLQPTPFFPKDEVLIARAISKASDGLHISWSKIKDADGYDIFLFEDTNSEANETLTIDGNKTFNFTKKGLKKKSLYGVYVKAFINDNMQKTYIKESPIVYAYTSKGTSKFTNAKSVTVEKSRVSLKKDNTYKIKAKINKLQNGKRLLSKKIVPTLRYISDNNNIATVNNAGKIKAKASGVCKIYVIAANGVRATLKVSVH